MTNQFYWVKTGKLEWRQKGDRFAVIGFLLMAACAFWLLAKLDQIWQLELFETVKRSYGKIWLLKMRFCGYYTLCPIYQIFEAACIQEKRRQGVTYFQTLYLISIYNIPCIKSYVEEHDMNYLQHGESYIYKGISASLIHIDLDLQISPSIVV